jgi:hypothetical protein
MIVLYNILQCILSFHMMSKECFSSNDISKISSDYLALTKDAEKEVWLFR